MPSSDNILNETRVPVNLAAAPKPPKLDIIETCCCCLEDFSDDIEVVKTKCKHVFHPDCLKGWIMTRLNLYLTSERHHNVRPNCPSCRNDIKIPADPLGAGGEGEDHNEWNNNIENYL